MAAMEEKIVAGRKKKTVPSKPAPIPGVEMERRRQTEAVKKKYNITDVPAPGALQTTEQGAYNTELLNMLRERTGAGSGPSPLDQYTRQLQAMLTGGSYAKPYEDLEAKLGELYGQAQPRIDTAMTNLQNTLQGMANPYANFQAQTTQVTPQLSQLLASQGVSQTPLQELAAVTNAQNAGQSTAFGNLVGTLKSIQDASQQGMLQDVASQRTDFGNALEQARLGMGAQIAQQRMGQQESLMKMLLSALAQGGRPKSGRLF